MSSAAPSEKPLTIALVSTQKGWRGGEVQAALLARGLNRQGHRCELFARREGEFAQRMQAEGIAVHTFSGSGRSPRGLWQLRRGLKRLSPNVLNANDSHALTAAGLASIGLPIAARIAARRVEFPVRSPRKYNRFADRIICVSQKSLNVCELRGIDPQKLRIVADGVDPERIAQGNRKRGRENLGLDDHEQLLLAVGALDESKGHADLLAALPAVVSRFPYVRLAIAGSGPYGQTLAELANQLKVSRYVRWLGFREDVADLIHAADLFVLPSRIEGLGSSLIEAMLAGTPIVATTAGGILELVGPRGAEPAVAWTVPVEDPNRLATAIIEALSSPELCTQQCEAARIRAEQHFTADRMVEATLAVYREALGSTP